MGEIVRVCCIKHVYPDKTQVDLCGLDFVVNAGERVVMLGPNGTGKTTLLSHVLGLLEPLEGEVRVFGVAPSKQFDTIRKKMGVVFQNVDEQIIGPTVYDDIAFGMRCDGIREEHVKEKVEQVAQMLQITELLTKIPHYLSGGQKKKVALAGAIILDPELLIMDEPFDGLDPQSKSELIDLINMLNKKKAMTTIITTHDINIVPDIADKIYVLCGGSIAAKGTPKQIFTQEELLRDAKLEAPILTQLFSRLKENGLTNTVPVSLEEAQELIEHLSTRTEN